MPTNVFTLDFKRAAPAQKLFIDDVILRSLIDLGGPGILPRLLGAMEAGVIRTNSTILGQYAQTGSLAGLTGTRAATNDPRVQGAINALNNPTKFNEIVTGLLYRNLPGYTAQSLAAADLDGMKVYIDDPLLARLHDNAGTPGAKQQLLFKLDELAKSGMLIQNSPALQKFLDTGVFDLTNVPRAAANDPRTRAIALAISDPRQLPDYITDLSNKGLPGYGGYNNKPKLDQDQLNALQIMKEQFADAGLVGLDKWLEDQIRLGVPEELIMERLEDTPQYATRFPAIIALKKQQQTNPNMNVFIPTEEEYIAFERGVASIAAQAGLFNLATKQNITDMVTNGISLAGFANRIEEGYTRLQAAAPETRQFFQQYFGPAANQALVSYFIDADNTEQEIVRALQVSEIGGAARLANIGIGLNLAERISDLGISYSEAVQGFGDVNQSTFLANRQVGENDTISIETLINSRFGLSGEASRLIEQRRRERIGRQGGAGFASSSGGRLAFGQG